MRPINEIIVHCSATKPEWMQDRPTSEKVAEIRRWHLDRGWRREGYHVFIDRDGTIVDGRPIEQTGAHVKGHNTGTIGICLIGGHGSDANDLPSEHFTAAQLSELRTHIDYLMSHYHGIKKVSGHNEYAAKACPGFRVGPWLAKKPQRTSKTQSKTLQSVGLAGVSTVSTGLLAAFGSWSENAQMAIIVGAFLTMAALAWIARERIKKWARGDR